MRPENQATPPNNGQRTRAKNADVGAETAADGIDAHKKPETNSDSHINPDAEINVNTRAKSGTHAAAFSDTPPNTPAKTDAVHPIPDDFKKISTAARAAIALIRIYKIAVSPALHLLGGGCRFFPTCSEYTILCIVHHGILKGVLLGACRILRCNPFCRGGLDYPPKNFSLKKLFSQNSVDEFGDFDKNPRI